MHCSSMLKRTLCSVWKLFSRNLVVRQLTDEEYAVERKAVYPVDGEEVSLEVCQKNVDPAGKLSWFVKILITDVVG